MNKDLVLTFEYKKMAWGWRLLLWLLLGFVLSLIALFIYLNVRVNRMVNQFAAGANLNKTIVLEQVNDFLQQVQIHYQQADKPHLYRFLILGTDKLSGRSDEVELSDTMILLQIDLKVGQIDLLSLPRDLYHQDYQTRINALYFYGQSKTPDDPRRFVAETIGELTGLTIDHTLVIDIETLEQLIAIVEPLELDVPTAFTDDKFPVPGIDVSQERDPAVLYESISFVAGLQEMDAATALKYIRSRHSGDEQGTDQARAKRQQLVLEALVHKLSSIRDPHLLGQIYRFYLDQFAAQLSLTEIAPLAAAYLKYIEQSQQFLPHFQQHQLTIYPADQEGVIVNPPLWQTKQQWIYQIRDENKFKAYVNELFN